MGSCVRGGGATAEARGRQAGRFPQQRRLVTRAGGREVPCGADRPTADRLERWVPGEVKDAAETRPLPPALQVVQPENFSFIKKTRLREARVSQNRSRRRGPHRASAQGMYRDFGEPGPSSGAGSAYGRPTQAPQAQAQAAQQQVRLAGPPERDLGLDVIRGAGVSLVCFGFRTATPSSVSLWWSRPWILHVLRGPGTGVPRGQGTGAAGGATI